jgi:hypothetical protein
MVKIRDVESGEIHAMKAAAAARYVVIEAVQIDISSAGSELVSLLKALPLSSSLGAGRMSATEFREVLCTAPISKHVLSMMMEAELESSAFEIGAKFALAEIEASLAGKVMGTSWPRTPAELGAAFKEKSTAGTFSQLEKAVPIVRTSLPPKSDEIEASYPLSMAMRSLCVSEAEFANFLTNSVELTTAEGRKNFVSQTEVRRLGALERFLNKMNVTGAQIKMNKGGVNGETLIEMIFNFEEAAQGGTQGTDKSHMPQGLGGAGTSEENTLVSGLGVLLGLDNKKDTHEKLAAGAVREAARKLQADPAALARLRAMQSLCAARDWAGAEAMRKAETDENMLMLIGSDIDDIESVLAGVLGDGSIGMLAYVRDGVQERVRATLFPKKPKRSKRQTTAIARACGGRLSKLRILELIDMPDKGTPDKPLAGFAALGDTAMDCFREALQMLQQIVTLMSPSQTFESMQYFRQLTGLFKSWLQRGASWTALSDFYRDLVDEMERPASEFARGAGGGGVLLNLDCALLDRNTEIYTTVEEAISDGRRERGGKQPRQPGLVDVADPTQMAPAVWKAQSEKLCKEVAAVDGKKPCRNFFIHGNCQKGNACGFHHKGTAGAYKPK